MEKLKLKRQIEKHLDQADDRVLRIVNSVFENYYREKKENQAVAYTVKGEPLTKKQYIDRIKQAEKDIENGHYTTHEDLLKEVEKW